MLHIEKTIENGKAFLVPQGRLDTVTAPEMEGVIKQILPGITSLTLDLAGLEYISSAGLRVLLALCKKIYREQNGSALRVTAAHAGLECGTFKALQPGLDMISIGPDLKDIHTVKETLCLRSLPKIWRLLEGLLAEYPAARP